MSGKLYFVWSKDDDHIWQSAELGDDILTTGIKFCDGLKFLSIESPNEYERPRLFELLGTAGDGDQLFRRVK